MFSCVDVSEYTEGIRITATEAKVMAVTNNSAFLCIDILTKPVEF